MKLEHDPGHGFQTPPRKSYNPFDSDDEDTNGYTRTDVSCDIKSFEENAESLTFHLDTADLSWEEAILAHAQIADHKVRGEKNGEEVVYRKDTELFTDKTVTECVLPELMVCYKDNSVKDIGIDEGVPTLEKVRVKSRDNEETKSLSTYLEIEDSVKEGRLDSEVFERQQHGTDGSKKVEDFNKDLSKREGYSGGKVTGNEMKHDQLSEKDDLRKIDKKENEVSEEAEHVVTLELPQESSEIPSIANDSNKNQTEEETSPQSAELQEVADVVEKEEDEKSEEMEAVVAKPPISQMMSRLDDSSVIMDHTSLPASMTHPASITYMGPHVHTGSISARSESSAGSTRSFAFPVLQAEWNSSPVRMAKAEQRHMRKHRGKWFSSLMCCRF